MEKNCRRNLKRQGINQIGCMWMFMINIFGSNQKRFLMDCKRYEVNDEKKKQLTFSSGSSKESVEEKKDIDVSTESEVYKSLDEEKFSEMIKRFIAQKEGEIKTCKDLLEALGSEEETFFKNVSNAKSLGESKRSEENKKPQEVPKKKGRFFCRKWKPDIDCSSSNKSKKGRTFSRFFIRIIKGRLQSKKSIDRSQEEVQSKPEKQEDSLHASEDSKMSSLYIAAKKHLSEMLANGDMDVNLSDKEVPIILGKILSLPEFSSPIDSPRVVQEIEEPNDIIDEDSDKHDIDEDSDKHDINEDSDKHEETLFTIDISVPREMLSGYEKEPKHIDNEEKTEIDPISQTCSSSIAERAECVDEDVLEEDGDERSLKKVESPPSSSARLSPVSVLEPLFTDDDNSPATTTTFTSAEMRLQPLCIRFDEADDSSTKPDNINDNVKTNIDDKELTLSFIEAVVKSSSLSWEELLTKPFHKKHFLEPTDEIVFYSTDLCDDKNLLYDCINEVLTDFFDNEFNPGPWISFLKPEMQLISDKDIAAKVAGEGVYWHLLPLPSPHSLDQIVIKDMAKAGSWMDLRFDIGCIGSYTGELILDELVEEIITGYIDTMKDQNNNNLL